MINSYKRLNVCLGAGGVKPRGHLFDDSGLCIECDTRQGASDYARQQGAGSLERVAKIAGTSRQNLNNWSRDKPDLFRAVVAGVIAIDPIG
jgi:hypothetical protein